MESSEKYKKNEILSEGKTISLVTRNQENVSIERKGLTIPTPTPNQNQNSNQNQQSTTTQQK